MPPPLRFALPPSTGLDGFSEAAAHLRAWLSETTGSAADVTVSRSYEVLTRNLLSGAVDAAWAPPFVCAKAEAGGARVLVQAVRRGRASYASALVCRAGEPLTMATLRGRTAAWVDPWSVAGYLLPVAHLTAQGSPPGSTFGRQGFAGSYAEALRAVLEGQADLACVHCVPDEPASWADAVEVHRPGAAGSLTLVGVTEAVPSDGVVVGPRAEGERLRRAFTALASAEGGRALLHDVFRAEGFAPAAPRAYRALYHLAPR